MNKLARRHLILGLIAALSVTILVISIIMITSATNEYEESAEAYDNLAQHVSFSTIEPIKSTNAPDSYNLPNEEAAPSAWPSVDFKALARINPDVVAWIICEDTRINYPVVQGDDNAYYLRHLFDGKNNGAGSLFVDTNNEPGFVDLNTVIYGHNMKDKSMFATILEYKNQEFFNQHPTMILLTPDGNYIIELFSGYVANVEDKCWKLWFSSNIEFEQWITDTKLRSSFKSSVEAGISDRFITLSTCSNEFDNARYVVVGKLVPTE